MNETTVLYPPRPAAGLNSRTDAPSRHLPHLRFPMVRRRVLAHAVMAALIIAPFPSWASTPFSVAITSQPCSPWQRRKIRRFPPGRPYGVTPPRRGRGTPDQ